MKKGVAVTEPIEIDVEAVILDNLYAGKADTQQVQKDSSQEGTVIPNFISHLSNDSESPPSEFVETTGKEIINVDTVDSDRALLAIKFLRNS